MAALIFFLGLGAPFVMMIWLTRARRRAQAKADAMVRHRSSNAQIATEDISLDQDGHLLIHRNPTDGELLPPDPSGVEPAGIRALQGRR